MMHSLVAVNVIHSMALRYSGHAGMQCYFVEIYEQDLILDKTVLLKALLSIV
ncbi:hypothetical protein [Shewanella phaeophyticola]|uniref:Uncharacterized protein n=1 Tax=Shewanella phaeophyticola TaxID=2978345 RepID=A0ABT2NZC9_9GAMM|nr:hypothetical protein [Shewanella sp. KJ10-1]MCT8985582.1 hypothetical protein [Shewanella sp. KJ10-1]